MRSDDKHLDVSGGGMLTCDSKMDTVGQGSDDDEEMSEGVAELFTSLRDTLINKMQRTRERHNEEE